MGMLQPNDWLMQQAQCGWKKSEKLFMSSKRIEVLTECERMTLM